MHLRRRFFPNRRFGRSPQSRMLGTLNAVQFAMFLANGHRYLRLVTSRAYGGELNRHIATSASPWRVPRVATGSNRHSRLESTAAVDAWSSPSHRACHDVGVPRRLISRLHRWSDFVLDSWPKFEFLRRIRDTRFVVPVLAPTTNTITDTPRTAGCLRLESTCIFPSIGPGRH